MACVRRLPSIIALLLAAATCGVLGILLAGELQRSTPSTSPHDAIRAATDARAAARDQRFQSQDRSWDVDFATGMVRDLVTWRIQPGTPATTDYTVVNATPGADLAATGRACAEAERSTRVQCYVFANTEAYEFKNITDKISLDTPTAIVNLCWVVRASNTRAGGPIEIDDLRAAPTTWDAQQCPKSWLGTGGGDAS